MEAPAPMSLMSCLDQSEDAFRRRVGGILPAEGCGTHRRRCKTVRGPGDGKNAAKTLEKKGGCIGAIALPATIAGNTVPVN